MFDWIFAPSIKSKEPTYPNLHEIIVDLESRVEKLEEENKDCLLYTSPSPRDS